MLARDVDAQPVQYRTWIVDGVPDYTGQFYTGDKSGPNPFVDVSAYAIFNPGQVCDFNLPNPLDWGPTYKTLPTYICDAHIAIVGGYIYLFGGQNSNKIYRASVNNPADFKDTGATLPLPLAAGQLAVLNDTIWIFGGTTDATLTSATDVVISAPVSDPLTWTNHGSILPRRLHHSQLAVINNTIYLFGGNEINNAVSDIFSAPLSNPLDWSETGSFLPDPLYGSQLAVIGDFVYLFGGLFFPDTPTVNIYAARLNNPTVWFTAGFLPYPIAYGQFCTIGAQGYLFTPTAGGVNPSYTKILRCNLSQPLGWVDTQSTITGSASQSHLAIVYDRIWLYGGSGSTIVLANNSVLKYKLDNVAVFQYGNVTRTQVKQAPTYLDLFQVLGFPPWKTDYGT